MAVATIIGTVVAFLMVPMRSLGPDNWKIAAALMGSYIGGCKLSESFGSVTSVSGSQVRPFFMTRTRLDEINLEQFLFIEWYQNLSSSYGQVASY